MPGDIRSQCEMPADANSCKPEFATSCSPANRSSLTHDSLAVCRPLNRVVEAIIAVVLIAAVAAVTIPGTARAMDWNQTKELVRTEFPDAPQLSISGLSKHLERQSLPPLVIDVRDAEEYAVSHLPGAVHAQGGKLERLVRETGAQRPIVLYCSVGYRSARETEKLRRKGYSNVSNLEGSIFEWANAGKPLVRGGPQSQIPTDAVHPFDEAWGALLNAEHRSYVPRVD
ncbi:MAG: rhodanese-like domain-containing protein [Anderseniella sp.]